MSDDSRTRGPRKRLSVEVNGKSFTEGFAADVFVSSLCEIGLPRVAELGLAFGSSPLICRHAPAQEGRYRQVGEWFIKTHSSTPEKHSILERVANRLGISISVEVKDSDEYYLS